MAREAMEVGRMSVSVVFGYAPLAAAAFAVPEFLPQALRLWRSGDTAGLSWSWSALTSLDNAAWFIYFLLSKDWTALMPSSAVTVLAGALVWLLARRGKAGGRPAAVVFAWGLALAGGLAIAGRSGLGALLSAAFVLQVTPSVWAAYRAPRPTGVSRATWALIFGELACWLAYGIDKSDPRLLALGTTGVIASTLMLARSFATMGVREAVTA
jgi:uncharacterized protein with PQ loop repeat